MPHNAKARKSQERTLFLAPIILTFIYAVIISAISPVMPLVDSAGYADVAKNIAMGRGFVFNFENDYITDPGFPYILSVFIAAAGYGNIIWAMKIYAFFTSFLIFLTSYLLSKEFLKGVRISLLTALLFSLIPELIFNELQMLSDSIFTVFTLLTILFYIRFLKEENPLYTTLCGLSLGASILVREMGLVLLPMIFIHYGWLVITGKRKVSMKMLILLVSMAMILSPWYLSQVSRGLSPIPGFDTFSGISGSVSNDNLQVLGKVEVSLKTVNMNRVNDIWEEDPQPRESTIDTHLYVPYQLINLIRLGGIMLLYIGPIVLLLIVYALIRKRIKLKGAILNDWKYSLLVIWVILFPIINVLVGTGLSVRYIIPFSLPIFIAFSMVLMGIKNRNIILLLLLLHLIFVAGVLYADYNSKWQRVNTQVFYDSGIWLNGNTDPNETIYHIGGLDAVIPLFSDRRSESISPSLPMGAERIGDYIMEIKEMKPGIVCIGNAIFRKELDDLKVEENLIKALDYDKCAEFKDGRFFARIYKKEC